MNISPDAMTALANKIQKLIEAEGYGRREHIGFAVMICPINNPGQHVRYASNCEREDIRSIFRNLLGKWDTDEHVKLGGKI
mgnify:CR=1 FL=1